MTKSHKRWRWYWEDVVEGVLILVALLAAAVVLSSCVTTRMPLEATKPGYGKTITVHVPILVEDAKLDGSLPNGKVTRFLAGPELGDGSQREGQKPLFILRGNATLQDVRLSGADGVHIDSASGKKASVLRAHWDDVGEDAITIAKGAGEVRISDCSFQNASDKVIQVNSSAGVVIAGCRAEEFGTFARGCGTCGDIPYRITIKNLTARHGSCVLRLTNPKARGWIKGGRFTDVKTPAVALNGAKISQK